jgi:hypothetical protein
MQQQQQVRSTTSARVDVPIPVLDDQQQLERVFVQCNEDDGDEQFDDAEDAELRIAQQMQLKQHKPTLRNTTTTTTTTTTPQEQHEPQEQQEYDDNSTLHTPVKLAAVQLLGSVRKGLLKNAQLSRISPSILSILATKMRIATLEDLLLANRADIQRATKLSLAQVNDILSEVAACIVPRQPVTALQLLQDEHHKQACVRTHTHNVAVSV